jgi:ABC-2 type transport system ATP-binding protein
VGRGDFAVMTMQDTPTAALEVSGAHYSYGRHRALDGVTFSVAPASFCVLLGLNGAGKSTLVSLVTRLFTTQSGRIRIFGHDVAREPGSALRRLGVVFQSRALDLDISVRENLLYHAALHGIAPRMADEAIKQVIGRVALQDCLKDRAGSLSGGQMRRIEIARALIHQPDLLLLDEPTAGLDVRARTSILSHVRALGNEGVAALWATHLIDEVAESDHVVILHRGAVLAYGEVSRIVADARATNIRDAFARLVGEQEQRFEGQA